MSTYLVLDTDGNVVNAVVWDGGGEWSPPTGHEIVSAPEGKGIGWQRKDGQWHDNRSDLEQP